MNCLTNFNCCQQPDICPKNGICKPINSIEQPWKRFTCKFQDGYNRNQPITSCQGYASGSRISGMYKVVGHDGSMHEVYCHFDSDRAMTLVQSYSLGNISNGGQFQSPLYENIPVSENRPIWSGYRLSRPRMKSIKDDSDLLLFTCDYEISLDVKNSDYFAIPFEKIGVDVTETSVLGMNYAYIGYGKLQSCELNKCRIKILQGKDQALHVHLESLWDHECECFKTDSCYGTYELFGSYSWIPSCVEEIHSCVQNEKSTSQLWFGVGTA